MSSKESSEPRASEVLSLDAVLELLQNPRKLFWLNFKAGFVRGFAGVIGAVLALVIIGFLAANLGGLPIIGDIIMEIGKAVQSAR